MLDKTFCASPACVGKCGRKMTEEERAYVIENNREVWQGYFCDDKGVPLTEIKLIKKTNHEILFLGNFKAEPLGEEFEKVLHDNLWDLYGS